MIGEGAAPGWGKLSTPLPTRGLAQGRTSDAKPSSILRGGGQGNVSRGAGAYLAVGSQPISAPAPSLQGDPEELPHLRPRVEGCNGAVISLDANPAPMVKRPLTRITYPVGLSARFGPPLRAVRVIWPLCRGTLLSA
jgi:hypothetical protein